MYSNSNRNYFATLLVFSIVWCQGFSQTQCQSYNQSNPFNPTFSGNTIISCGGSTTLTCSEVSSKWYAQASGGSPISSSNVLTVNPLSTTTYYVQREVMLSQTATFNFTGNQQTWVVPTGVTSISVSLFGAKGANGTSNGSNNGTGGAGGKIEATISVTSGQIIYINVGGMPTCLSCGGWNGGGAGTASSGNTYGSGGGGGSTDIRIGGTALSNRVVVAAGGGGGGCGCACCGYGYGGNGGGLVGSDSYYPYGSFYDFNYGHGGTQTSGGLGGSGIPSTANGIMGQGGAGYNFGAGGGGGYFGGGGGIQDMGGGGGSSFAYSLATNVVHNQGVNSGNGSVSITYQAICESSRVSKTVTVNSIPAPSNPTSNSPQCNSVTITRSGLPPSGTTWYWQGTNSGGTSTTLGSGTTYNATSTGTYYIRALNSSGCWSSGSGSTAITISANPASPSNPTSNSPQCGSVTLTRSGTPTSGITWYWQGTNANGTSTTLGSGTTYTATVSGTYYIRARNSSGCWSSSSGSVNVTISGNPNNPPDPTSDSPQCTSVTITRSGTVPSGETWYWQGTNSSGTSTSLGIGSTYTTSTSGTYYIRARNTTGCWSNLSGSSVVNVTGYPAIPSGLTSDSPSCETVTLTTNSTPPTGTNWYWQGTNSNGTSTTLGSGSSFTANSTGTYYLRARNSANCWSNSSAGIPVTVLNNSTAVQSPAVCDSFMAPDSVNYTISGQYQAVIPNFSGCDSLITINLTVNNSYSVQNTIMACQSHTWIDGNTYSTDNNTATYLLTSIGGCDSLVTLDLHIGQPTGDTTLLQTTAVNSYSLNGITYTENGTYFQTLSDQYGCDSTVALQLIFDQSSLKQLKETILKVYPNPSEDGVFHIQSEKPFSIKRLYDYNARSVSFEITGTELTLNHLDRGIYFLEAILDEQIITMLLIKN